MQPLPQVFAAGVFTCRKEYVTSEMAISTEKHYFCIRNSLINFLLLTFIIKIMKKTNFFYAAVLTVFCAFGVQSCIVEDNPAPQPPTEPEEPVVVEPVEMSLQEVPFCEWTAFVNGEVKNPAGCAWVIGESTGQPYGDGNVNNYADLSGFEKLVVIATEGTPRMLFNRDIENGQCSENEEESHLIDNTNSGCMTWAAKYFTSEEIDGATVWTVDLTQLVKDKGFAHLHAIKGGNWQNVTVTEMKVIYTPAE